CSGHPARPLALRLPSIGMEARRARGKPATGVYADPNDRDSLMTLLMKEKHVKDYEVHLKRKDGTILYVSVGAQLLSDDSGRPAGVAGILRDISERKQSEEKIRRANQ